MNYADLQKEVEKNLEQQIKRVFSDAIDNDGDFDIEADYDTHTRINDVVEKIGLEVCGMHIRQSEFIVEFEFGEKFLSIPNFPLRECHISLQNDGNYYLTLYVDSLSSSWWFGMTDVMHNFKEVNSETATQILNDMNKVIEFNYLSI
ncbi:MAG: hypothetical protein FGM17_06330 [Polynucleobacter sp.]|uniref:hypothetical protein n=1 Tax=Polynucleobacter sp. TaxID=2029855 RepID=UPI00216BD112|nr:hypothetical protein [Polynucleobacter sp.]MBU3670319.1 hypothetical protein [Polynucleobacter sp.]